jgi:predicted transcriptional regulator
MNFACKNFKIEEVIRCSLSLTKAEFKMLEYFMRNQSEKISTDKISKDLGLNLSTVQRCVKKMTEEEILRRTQLNIRNGGYLFYYCVCDKREIKTKIKDIIKKWFEKTNEEITKW